MGPNDAVTEFLERCLDEGQRVEFRRRLSDTHVGVTVRECDGEVTAHVTGASVADAVARARTLLEARA